MMKSGSGMLTRNKNILKKHSNKTDKQLKIVTAIVTIYFSIVVYLSVWSTLKYLFLFPLIILFIFCLFKKFTKSANEFVIPISEKDNDKSQLLFFITVFCVIFAGQILYWLAYYPGGFNLDALGQWDQVHSNMQLNDWHPVFTTACYWLITRVYDNFAFCIFVQLLLFSFSVAFLLLRIYRLKVSPMLLIFIALYIAINPAVGMNNVCLFKDVPFTIALVWMSIIIINLIESKGIWLKSLLHLYYIIIDLLIVTLTRHNGIFCVVPLIICIAVLYRRKIKRVVSIIIVYSIMLSLIQGPVYAFFSVEKHSNVTGEAVGIPMAIMANSYLNDYDNTPQNVKSFVTSVADKKEWKENYVLGEWDSCKWNFGGTDLFKDEPLSKFVKMTISTTVASPETTYQSLRENTRVVWQIFGYSNWDTWVYIEDNDYGIIANHNPVCSHIADCILRFSLTSVGSFLFWNIGAANALFMILILLVVARKESSKLVYCFPFVCYNLLTMLLLCGPSHRYFYFNSVLALPVMTVMLKENYCLRKDSKVEFQ
ncbi:MAG: DUF6020 family protein [Eubacterium sp.]|nr:DUF6020 family protein [Eubacterium sp.]